MSSLRREFAFDESGALPLLERVGAPAPPAHRAYQARKETPREDAAARLLSTSLL